MEQGWGSNESVYIYKQGKEGEKWIFQGTKTGKRRMVITQDPRLDESITLIRSENEESGIEFSYSFWFFVDDWTYRYGEWKHILHKGSESGNTYRAPGILLHPKKNKLRVVMNTFNTINDYVDIDNIPMNKWVNVVVAVRQTNLDVYINGGLKVSHKLSSLPKQNYGNVYLSNDKGFSGYLSNIRYFNYYITFAKLDSLVQDGPSQIPCVDTGEKPPFLSPNWWTTRFG